MLSGAAALLLTAVGVAGGVSAQEGGDPRAQREQVRAERAAVAAEVDALEADANQVAAALADLQSDVTTQRAALADAQRALADADAELARLDAEIDATETEIDGLHEQLRRLAVDAYVEPPVTEGFGALQADTAEQSAQKRVYLELQGSNTANLLDRLRGASARLEEQRERAEDLRRQAEGHRAEVAARTEQVEAAYQRQATFNAQVEARLNERLGEAEHLASLDGQLSEQIAAEEAAVAARLAAARQREAEAAAAARRVSSGGSSGSGSSGGAVSIPVLVGAGDLVTIGGITVNRSISGSLQGLLSAASGAGIVLGGTGWRDSSAQISLRMQHCGTSDYAIYQMPPEQCSPPTAIPGRSKHEQGLAVDFSCNGAMIQSRSSECFVWLAANAGSYGWVNLPSEPWHWSVGGG